jgi:hypothetical protein
MRNGTRARKRLSGIDTIAPAASPEETAAISSALEQFLAETAPAAERAQSPSGWQRAALREAVEAREVSGRTWGPTPG